MIENIVNSASFSLSLFDAEGQAVDIGNVVAQEYKLYTDNGSLYLYVQYVSPMHLLDIKNLASTKKVHLEFLNEEQKPVCFYSVDCLGYSIEFEGTRIEKRMLKWEVIWLVDFKTIRITNPQV